ncbi:MAG: IS5/IS1182 family transposase, partial [Methanobacterium formicicum]|nr:IS5/IS1182 family transposase [Methanobacterium formicicum]
KDTLTYPLRVFKDKKTENQSKRLSKILKRILIQTIQNWKRYKPISGKIEDFFKLCKSGLSLNKIHKYPPKSAEKTTILTVLLSGLITTQGYNTKTALQKLSET